jgi:outer membrane protein OmpA-like peptidoglycan-associated protein
MPTAPRRHLATRLSLAVVCLVAVSTAALAADAPGSKDHPLLKRIAGSEILRYGAKNFDTHAIALAAVVFDYNSQKILPWKRVDAEGARTTIFYRLPKDASTLECVRGYQGDLAGRGFQPLFEGSSGGKPTGPQNTLDNGYGRFLAQVYSSEVDYGIQRYSMAGSDDYRYLAMKKAAEGVAGDVYVTIYCAAMTASWKDPAKGIDTGTVIARVDVIETKGMDNRMVTVKADEMDKALSTAGRVALYGITFDTNKADVRPESEPTLVEMAKLAKSKPGMRLLVVGHTDNVGGYDSNKSLSERRAAAVVAALTGKHGVDAKALVPVGVSFAAPVAPNTTDDGRAKNRRVELVPY